MSLSAGRFLHSAKKVQGIGVAVEPVLCKRYIVSANQIQLLTRQFLPRVFFHILGFGGKPHDKRSILVIAATPATISGFLPS